MSPPRRPVWSATDRRFMARALTLAARGLGRTHPNPPVGAVFVRGGRVIAEGFHRRAGGPHAEIDALRRVDAARLRDATLYVTLEPCAHQGRTPPCVAALVPLGLRRVVVATIDPNPRVRGRSLRRLRAAGVAVAVGCRRAEADALIAGFRQHVLTGRPLVTLKLAATLDGRIAAANGDSRWITGAAARRLGHALRDQHDAILVGAATVRADDPALTCRTRGGRDPVRIVLSGEARRLRPTARVFAAGETPRWLVTAAPVSAAARRRWTAQGVEVLTVGGRGGRVAWLPALRAFARRGITTLLIEGGSTVAASALRAGVVDRVVWFVAPTVLGGDALAAVGTLGIRRVAAAVVLDDVTMHAVDRDFVLLARVRHATRRRVASD